MRASEVADQEGAAPVRPGVGAACGALRGQGDRRPGRIATKEGDPVARAFIVRSETYERTLACYEDPAYQVAATFGKQASARDVVILEGP